MFVWCRPVEKAPNRAEYIEIDYQRGDPVAVNGRKLSPANLLARLNDIGAKHGIGRVDVVENRYVGMKSRGVYETPGGTILHAAHRGFESITMDREVLHLRDSLIPRYAEMIYYGYWFAPEREVLQKADRRRAGERERPGAAQTLQGQCHGRGAEVGYLALRSQRRNVRSGSSLSSSRRRGFHPAQRLAAQVATPAQGEARVRVGQSAAQMKNANFKMKRRTASDFAIRILRSALTFKGMTGP